MYRKELKELSSLEKRLNVDLKWWEYIYRTLCIMYNTTKRSEYVPVIRGKIFEISKYISEICGTKLQGVKECEFYTMRSEHSKK